VRAAGVSALVFCLSGSPALAQSLQELARAEAVRAAAQATPQPDAYRPGGMAPGYFWTSVSLMGAGAVYLAVGAVVEATGSSRPCVGYDFGCPGIGKVSMAVGAGMAGTGALLWVLGKNKARAAGNPQIVTMPGGWAVRSRIRF
jgi:hypothetical protein